MNRSILAIRETREAHYAVLRVLWWWCVVTWASPCTLLIIYPIPVTSPS